MRLAIVFLIALAAFEAVPQAEAQADPCASPEIASVGGSVSNGYALWVWKGSPLDDGFCWYDFKLSYSDDYGATFTEAAVVRRGMHTTATEYRYSIGTVPEMSIVSQLQVSVCAPDSDTCHHTLKSTDASLGQYYRSRFEDRMAGANTRAVLGRPGLPPAERPRTPPGRSGTQSRGAYAAGTTPSTWCSNWWSV